MSAEFEKTDYENADYETIIKDIRRWDKNEVFYREAWQRRSRGESLDELREGDICILAPDVDHGIEVFDDSIVLNVLIRYSTFAQSTQQIYLRRIILLKL